MHVEIILGRRELELVYRHSLRTPCGKSQFRGDEKRKRCWLRDQLVGFSGEMALAMWLFGDSGVDRWVAAREVRERNPWQGDGGRDVPGEDWPWDIKSTLMKSGSDLPADGYSLVVSPGEYREGWVYLSCLQPHHFGFGPVADQHVCWLTGWAPASDLVVRDSGWARGRRALFVRDLRPLSELTRPGG